MINNCIEDISLLLDVTDNLSSSSVFIALDDNKYNLPYGSVVLDTYSIYDVDYETERVIVGVRPNGSIQMRTFDINRDDRYINVKGRVSEFNVYNDCVDVESYSTSFSDKNINRINSYLDGLDSIDSVRTSYGKISHDSFSSDNKFLNILIKERVNNMRLFSLFDSSMEKDFSKVKVK